MADLQHSRDLLSDNVRRLGDALQRTHDLDGLLATVAAISASTTESVRATVWLLEGDSLMARVAWPVESARGGPRRVSRVDTLPGLVSGDGVPRRIEGGGDAAARLGGPALASPLQRGTTVLGAVVVERSPGSAPYSDEDSAILLSITGPAGIAIDNVLLHRQAQRLSVTDPLTGVGNLRILTTTLAREIERARLFQRDVALLMLDLDHFKRGQRQPRPRRAATRCCASSRTGSQAADPRGRHVRPLRRRGVRGRAARGPRSRALRQLALSASASAVRREPFDVEGEPPVDITVSVGGAASRPARRRRSATLLRAADAALYVAKGERPRPLARAPDASG